MAANRAYNKYTAEQDWGKGGPDEVQQVLPCPTQACLANLHIYS